MKRLIIGILLLFAAQMSFAQISKTEHEIRDISKAKWQWMADKKCR